MLQIRTKVFVSKAHSVSTTSCHLPHSTLSPWNSKCGPQSNRIGLPWGLVRNSESWAPSHIYRVRIWILTKSPGDWCAHEILGSKIKRAKWPMYSIQRSKGNSVLLSFYSASVLSLRRPIMEQMWVVRRDGGLPSQAFNCCKWSLSYRAWQRLRYFLL